VRETIGYSKERGDSVNLMNTPFLADAKPTEPLPLWKQPETIELAKSFAWPVGMVLFALLVLLGLVRPALRQPKPAEIAAAAGALPGTQLDALEDETVGRPALPPKKVVDPGPTPEELRLEEARLLALENPMAVANILKTWVNGEA